MLLHNPSDVPADSLPEGLPLVPPIALPTSRQPCLGLDDAVEVVEGLETLDAYDALGILQARSLRLRTEVARRIRLAQSKLPAGYRLVVLDGWRRQSEQRALLDHYSRLGPTESFVAALSADAMRPPHTTGGAVDLTLAWEARPLALGTDFDAFTDLAHLHAFEGVDGRERRLRRLLAAVMSTAGFSPYESEWWHWSYGDDVWAAAGGRKALYDIYETPDASEAIDRAE